MQRYEEQAEAGGTHQDNGKRTAEGCSGGWMKQVEYMHAVADWSEPCRTGNDKKRN